MTHYHKYIRKSDPCTTGFAYKGVYETTKLLKIWIFLVATFSYCILVYFMLELKIKNGC